MPITAPTIRVVVRLPYNRPEEPPPNPPPVRLLNPLLTYSLTLNSYVGYLLEG